MLPKDTQDPVLARPGPGRFWRQGNARVLGWFVGLLATDVLAQTAAMALTGDVFLSVAAASLLAVVIPLALLARAGGGTLASEFDLGRVPPGAIFWAIVAGLGALMPVSFLADQSLRLHPIDQQWLQRFLDALPRGPSAVAVGAVAVVIVVPTAEELLFRGLLQRLARRVWGAPAAMLISALVFAIAHGEPWYLFGLVGLGILLAWVYEVTGSLTPCVALHAFHNAVSYSLLLSDGRFAAGAASLDMDLWLLAISLAALVTAATRLARYGR